MFVVHSRAGSSPAFAALLFATLGAGMAEAQPVTFRISDLDLRDPHLFVQVPFFGCQDFTDTFLLGPSFNEQLATSIQTDGDGDGYLDLNSLIVFDPLDPSGAGGELNLHFGRCTAPVAGTVCTGDPESMVLPVAYANSGAGTCLQPRPGTVRPYSPPIATPLAPCFATDPFDIMMDLGGVAVPLQAAQIGATYAAPGALASGLMFGFLSQADAAQVTIPPDVPLVGGQPLTVVLPGGAGCCAPHDDRDVGPDGLTVGWWMYLNFVGVEVPFSGPLDVLPAGATLVAAALDAAMPNPLRETTTFRYVVPRAASVRLAIYDLAGRRVATLVDASLPAGAYRADWDGRVGRGGFAAPGVYFVRLDAPGGPLTGRVVVTGAGK